MSDSADRSAATGDARDPGRHHGNADRDEIEKFSRLAADWWDPAGTSRPLHAINPVRVAWLSAQAGDLRGQRIADIGCGGGILAESLAAADADVVGIDLSAPALEAARLHLRESGLAIDYRECSAEDLAQAEPGSFDTVACMEMLEHVPEPATIVGACARLLRPGGTAVFSTIDRNPRAWLLAIAGAEHLLRILPRGTHEYARFIRPAELACWCRRAGLDVGATRGIRYNPLTGACHLDPRTDVNYLLAARQPVDDNG